MNFSKRHKARALALQALYQWQHTFDSGSCIAEQFYEQPQFGKAEKEYFTKLLYGVIANQKSLDDKIRPFLDRALEDLNPVELAVLRLATYELMHCLDVPFKVVINEALEIAKAFGSDEGFKYVNGVLDKVARQLRALEI